MKYILPFLLLLITYANAQNCRYINPVFTSTTKQSNVVYATALGIPTMYVSESNTTNQNLTADIYMPNNDTAQVRPLIIFAHSGGFLTGSKDNSDMQALCDSFAKCGYVTATINYRQNFNTFNSNSAERAVWRGTQDASSAVRYFKQNAVTYKIDTSRIFFWGSSAGSFMALNLAYLDDAEKPASITTTPNLGCKNCSGIITANHNESIAGIISCWGAIGDTAWINNTNNIPAIMFHGTSDAYVPINAGHPFGVSTLPITSGSNIVNQKLNNTNIYHEYYPATGQSHEYWGTTNGSFALSGPTTYWEDIIQKSKMFMLRIMGLPNTCSALAVNNDKLSVNRIQDNVNAITLFCNNLDKNASYTAQYSLAGSDWKDIATHKNTGVTSNQIIFYHTLATKTNVLYRMKIEDPNGSVSFSNTVLLECLSMNKEIIISPNPAKHHCKVTINNATAIQVVDVFGHILLQKDIKGAINNVVVNLDRFKSGVYFVKAIFLNGDISTQKLIVE